VLPPGVGCWVLLFLAPPCAALATEHPRPCPCSSALQAPGLCSFRFALPCVGAEFRGAALVQDVHFLLGALRSQVPRTGQEASCCCCFSAIGLWPCRCSSCKRTTCPRRPAGPVACSFSPSALCCCSSLGPLHVVPETVLRAARRRSVLRIHLRDRCIALGTVPSLLS